MTDLTLQSQKRAMFAYGRIAEAKGLPLERQTEVKSYIQSLPAMIQINGFGQAIAFCKSHPEKRRGGEAYQAIYKWLAEWLKSENIYNTNNLMKEICDQNMQAYQLATAETQALLVWLKKFARAELDTGA